MPVVSHSVMPRTPSSPKALHPVNTVGKGTSPSIGQPKLHDSDTFTATPACARATVDLRQRHERLLARHAQVGQVVRLAGRHHQVQLVRARVDGALGTAHVGHQRAVDTCRARRVISRSTISHRPARDGLGRDERSHLDLGQAGFDKALTSAILSAWARTALLHLQAVARPTSCMWMRRPAPCQALFVVCTSLPPPLLRSAQSVRRISPISASTASVSSPRCGALLRMVPGVADQLGHDAGHLHL
jgi:hypothetical protein